MSTWRSVIADPPPEGVVVWTKISDGTSTGDRNVQLLKRVRRLWFLPDGSMYVYYTPTAWKLKD